MALTFLTRVENLVGTVVSVSALNDWLTTGARLFIDLLPQKEFLEQASFLTLNNNDGVNGYRLDWGTASGNAKKLVMLPSSMFEMVGNSNSLYSIPAAALGVVGATIREAQIQILPGGETVKVLGIQYPTVVNTQASVVGLPTDWLHALSLYVAIHARKRQAIENIVLQDVTVGDLPTAPSYFGPTLTLTSPPSDFTTSAVPPTAPSAPTFTYNGPTPLVLGSVQIALPSNPPTYTAPVLALESPPADFVPTGISIPTAPEPPSIFSTDAIAATLPSVTVGALPSAPVYTPPSLNLAPPPADLVYSGSVTVPTSPTTPNITSSDATAGITSSVTIASLPTAPTYTAPVMAWTNPPNDYVPGIAPPAPPDAPNITYSDATGATVSTVNLAALGTAPAFTYSPSAGPTITFTMVWPSVPDMPSFTYTDVPDQVIQAVGLDSLPTPPVFVPVQDMDLTGMDYPTPPDLSQYPQPVPPETPSFSWVDATVSTIVDSFTIDISTSLGELTNATTGYINGVEDIELAMAKIQEIEKRLQEFQIEFNADLEKAKANAQLTTDVNKFNELHTLEAQVQTAVQQAAVYTSQVQGYLGIIQAQTRLYESEVAGVTAERNAEIQRYINGMNGAVSKLDGEVKVFTAQVQAIIEEARIQLEEQRTRAQLNGNIQLQNALQQVETDVKEYQATLQRYANSLAVVTQQWNQENAKLRLDMDKWLGGEKLAYDNAIGEFNEDIQEYQATLQRLLAQGRIDIEKAIADAQISTDVSKQNEIYTFQAAVQDYVQELELFKAKVGAYQTQVNEEISTFRANLEKWQVVRTTEIQKYSQDVVAAQAAFNAEVESYRAAIARNQRQAELDLQRYIAQAGLDTDVDKDNKSRTLQALIQDYVQELNLYEKDIAKYQAVVNAEVARAKANFDKWQVELQGQLAKYASDISNAQHSFEVTLAEFQAGVQKLIKQADIDAALAQDQARLDTDVSKANSAQKLAADIQRWSGELQLYAESLKGYTVQTQNEIAVFRTNLEKWQTVRTTDVQTFQAQVQSAAAAFQAEMASYQAELQTNIEQARLDAQRIADEAKLASDVNMQNALQELAKQVQEYSAELQLYATSVRGYEAELQGQIAVFQANLSKWQTVATTEIQKFQGEIENARAKLQGDLAGYTSAVQKIFKQADIDIGLVDLRLRAEMAKIGDWMRELTMFFQLKGIPFNMGANNDSVVDNRASGQ